MTTPPPQGQKPYGQPQGGNPYGDQAPQGYPQQPGQPMAPQQGSPYLNQGGPAMPPPSASNRPKLKTIKNVALVVIGVLVIGGGWIASRDDAQAAAVGDCMSLGNAESASDPDLEVIDCGDSKAKYKVVQKKDGASGGCDRTKYSEYTQSGDGDSFTLCLENYTK